MRPVPFIPTEQGLDSLIAGCRRKLSAFLQLLKETAMRSGEAKRLLWTEIDAKANTIRLNNPEKGSNPRMWQVSPTLIGMINALPKTHERAFGAGPVGSMKSTFWKTRKGLAYKLQNPRLLKISFHTFRHWKATMLYHEKPDTLYVRDFLGHKELRNTERYITIARTIFGPGTNDKFIIKIAANAEEAIGLGENGFEPFDVVDGVRLYRKRK